MGAEIASQAHSGAAATTPDEVAMRIDALWLTTLQRVCARAAHEVKGALNAVAVNVEVVRSRTDRQNADMTSVRPFAEAAGAQVEVVIALNEALLSLARVMHTPVELALIVRRLEALLAPSARADGGRLDVNGEVEALGTTSAVANAARLAIAAALLAALEASKHVRCTADGPRLLRIASADGATFSVSGDIVAAVAAAGIETTTEASVVTLRFPW